MKEARAIMTVLLLLVSGLSSAAQTVEVHSFTNLNRNVPDGNASGLSDVRTVTSALANISSVRVKLYVVGEFNGDLYGYVRQANATDTNFCVLLNRPGRTASNSHGYNDEGLDVTFDDAAVNGDVHDYQSVTNVPAGLPLIGVWKPDGRTNDPNAVLDSDVPATSLNSFVNGDADGEWILFLADLDSGATNMLLRWEIELSGTTNPTVSWASPASITYGTALDGNQLNASSPVAGTFSYTPTAGTVLHAGSNQTLTCVFVPDDTASYGSVTNYVSIDVLKQALTITADSTNKVYGAANPTFTASYSGFVNGDDAADLATPVGFVCVATAASDAGTYSITPGDATSPDYNITFVNGTLTINTAATALSVASSPNPSELGQEVLFTATVTAANATPVGTVTFYEGSTFLGSGNLSGGEATYGTSALGMGSHIISARYSGGVNFNGSTNTVSQTVNPPPFLEPIPDQVAYVLIPLMLTNHVINSNLLTQPLTFGLGAGAPDGAWVDTETGEFGWMPGREQARSTNVIAIWMTDSGSPSISATNIFSVVVDDYVELTLGRSAVLRPGETSSVPVTLLTSTGLTNLQALVQVPEDRLTPLALTGWAAEVGNATLQQQAANVWQIEFTALPGQALQGTQELAHLSFLAVTNQSAFIPLLPTITGNFDTNGVSVWRTLTGNGRVVVVGQEPLVEALPLNNGLPDLLLYGISGFSYNIQYTPVLPAANWQQVWLGTVPANLLVMPVSGLTNTGPTMFFRAQESTGE